MAALAQPSPAQDFSESPRCSSCLRGSWPCLPGWKTGLGLPTCPLQLGPRPVTDISAAGGCPTGSGASTILAIPTPRPSVSPTRFSSCMHGVGTGSCLLLNPMAPSGAVSALRPRGQHSRDTWWGPGLGGREQRQLPNEQWPSHSTGEGQHMDSNSPGFSAAQEGKEGKVDRDSLQSLEPEVHISSGTLRW